MAGDRLPRQVMDPKKLASLLRSGAEGMLVIDSRSFVEYNSWHVLSSVNICCSKLVKRRLQQDKVSIIELIQPTSSIKVEAEKHQDVVVYDQSTRDGNGLASDSFLSILLGKLDSCFHNVSILTGGFATFSSCFPGLCEGKPTAILPMSISQPCLPVANVGPTRILPHLYLGSQKDVLNKIVLNSDSGAISAAETYLGGNTILNVKDLMIQNGISYVLNASNSCPKPDFICESHFMRIPVNDNYCEKLLPWLDKSIEFIDKAKVSSCQVIVHCLAGISRSATIAIAYIMKTMGLSSDDAYKFVKDRRPSISPNFNFLGQLLEYERSLKLLKALKAHGEKNEGESSQERWEAPIEGNRPQTLCSTAEKTEELLRNTAWETYSERASGVPTIVSPTALQKGLNGLHLSSERIQDTNRLKRSFSLDIKSAYTPSQRQDAPGPAETGETPKLCKLDSPSSPNGPCQFSPVLDSPDRPSGPDILLEAKVRQRRKHRHQAGSPAHGLSLNFSGVCAMHKSTSMEESLKQTLRLSIPSMGQQLAQPAVTATSASSWGGMHLESPGMPSAEKPWYLSTDPAAGGKGNGSGTLFNNTNPYTSFSCSTIQASCEIRLRDKQRGEPRDVRHSWHEDTVAEKQFKRRSCQMEFEETLSESRSREDLGQISKQSNFSGSMEIIEVS